MAYGRPKAAPREDFCRAFPRGALYITAFTCLRVRLVTWLDAVKYEVKGGVLVEGDMRRWRLVHVHIQWVQSGRARSVKVPYTPKFEMCEAVM